MIAIGFGLAWVGYTLVFYGHSLVKGYNLSFLQQVSPTGYYTGAWPPGLAGGQNVFPSGTAADNATGGTATPTGGGSPLPCPPGFKLINGRCTNPNQVPGAK